MIKAFTLDVNDKAYYISMKDGQVAEQDLMTFKCKTPAMPNLSSIWPSFIVENLSVSVAFYVERLGFEVRYIGPDGDPYWAIVGRDQVSIMLKAVSADVKPVPNFGRHEWAPWDAYIFTIDPDSLFEEYHSNKVPFINPIRVNSDNLRGFEIIDADGYLLFFGRPEDVVS